MVEIDLENGSLIELLTIEKFISRLVKIKKTIVYNNPKGMLFPETFNWEKQYSDELEKFRDFIKRYDENIRKKKQLIKDGKK